MQASVVHVSTLRPPRCPRGVAPADPPWPSYPAVRACERAKPRREQGPQRAPRAGVRRAQPGETGPSVQLRPERAVQVACCAYRHRVRPSQRAKKPVEPIPAGALYARADQLAARYGVSVEYVGAHKRELGRTRISPGRGNSKYVYHLATADAYFVSLRVDEPVSTGQRGHRGKRRTVRASSPAGSPLVSF
jgi:hypothetical protein